jgi:hypothetical protein
MTAAHTGEKGRASINKTAAKVARATRPGTRGSSARHSISARSVVHSAIADATSSAPEFTAPPKANTAGVAATKTPSASRRRRLPRTAVSKASASRAATNAALASRIA